MRVTVIATGLDDGRIGRGRDREERDFAPSLRPIRRDADAGRAAAPAAVAAAPEPEADVAVEVEDWSGELPPAPARDEAFASPFDDEYDTPAFLRKKAARAEPGADRETPAFLRRSAD